MAESPKFSRHKRNRGRETRRWRQILDQKWKYSPFVHGHNYRRTVRSLWTWLWGRYHVPQNVFLVNVMDSKVKVTETFAGQHCDISKRAIFRVKSRRPEESPKVVNEGRGWVWDPLGVFYYFFLFYQVVRPSGRKYLYCTCTCISSYSPSPPASRDQWYFLLFWPLEKDKRPLLNKKCTVGSHAGFESACRSRGFCTRIRVWPHQAGQLSLVQSARLNSTQLNSTEQNELQLWPSFHLAAHVVNTDINVIYMLIKIPDVMYDVQKIAHVKWSCQNRRRSSIFGNKSRVCMT